VSLNDDFPQRTMLVSSLEVASREYRLDPTRYNERGERVIRHFRQIGVQTKSIDQWDAVKSIFVPPRFKRPYVESLEHGVPFLGSSSMLSLRLSKDSILSRSFRHLGKLTLQGGELLLSCSGTIGVSVLCGTSYKGFALSQHAARIYADEKVRGYLHVYLSTPPGREIVLQQNYGKVIKELTEDQIGRVVVPLVPEPDFSEINTMALNAASLYDTARGTFAQVDAQLQTLLGLASKIDDRGSWLSRQDRSFIVSSELSDNFRLDPHYHDPDIRYMYGRLASVDNLPLGTIAKIWMPDRFARVTAQSGYGVPFYSSADIMRARRVPSHTVSRRAQKHLDQCRVHPGITLVCRSGAFGGIMGRATLVSPAMDGWHVTEDALRCAVHDPDFPPQYVFAVLSNPFLVYPVITGYRYGKDVPHIDPEELSLIPIPKFTPDVRQEIARRIGDAFQQVDLANSMEDRAQTRLLQTLRWQG